MTKLITIPKFAKATGLPYRLCLELVRNGKIPSIPVGDRRRIDVRWMEQWLATGGYVTAGIGAEEHPYSPAMIATTK